MLRNTRSYAGVATHSVCKRTHEENIILTITGHELLFISLEFVVQKEYGLWGCSMNILIRLWIHIHNN